MSDNDLMYRSASELAAMVRAGEMSARELVECSLRRIEELNPTLNAFVEVDAERALAAADEVSPGDERPFAGVPTAIKNNRPVSGLRLTYGCELMRDFRVRHDHNVTRRLRQAGFIVVGSTTLPEYGILPTTEARLFGPTRNPWDLQRTPGGSSGGAAAAVAAGIVPVAHGNDGGGSIRIPAACCGLVGLKPARGRISVAPELGDSLLGIDGVLTRTVADTAAILDVLAGYELGDATWAPPPERPFAAAAAAGRAGGRAGSIRAADRPHHRAADPRGAWSTRSRRRRVEDAAELLRVLGHEVEEVEPPWRVEGAQELFGAVFSTHIGLSIAFSGMVAGREPTAEDMEPMSWAIYSMVRKLSAVEGLGATARLQAFTRQLVEFLHPYDALLTPALAERPLPLGTLDTAAPDPMSTFTRSGLFTPFTPVFNASGQPGISLPLFHGEDGLPLAVQLVGRPAAEETLLALAAQLEAARPWAQRRPERRQVSLSPEHRPPSPAATTPSRSASAVPARGDHRHLHQLRLVPRGERARAGAPPPAGAGRARDSGAGTCTSGRRRRSERSTVPHDRLLAERLRARPARSARGAGRPTHAGRPSRTSATSSAQIGWNARPAAARERHPRAAGRAAPAASASGPRARRRSRARTPWSAGPPRAPPARRAPWRAGSARGCGWRRRAPRRTRSARRRCARPPRPCARWRCPSSSSIEPRGWSRIEAARCTTVSTPRIALRKEGGSARSPRAICTRTRSGAQPARIAHQAADRHVLGEQAAAGARSPPGRWRRSAGASIRTICAPL